MPGVERIFTAADVPGQRGTGLAIPDLPIFVAVGETTCCVGDILALVVADTAFHARQAADKDQGRLRSATAGDGSVRGDGARTRRRCMRPAICTCIRTCWTPRRFRAAMWMRRSRLPRTSSSRLSKRSRWIRPFSSRRPAWRCRREKASRSIRRARARRSIKPRSPEVLNLPAGRRGNRAGVQRRIVRRERRAVHPGADGAGRASARTSGEDGADAQAIHAAPSQAPSDDAAATRWAPTPKAICWRCAFASWATREATPAPARNACCARLAIPAARIACPTWMSKPRPYSPTIPPAAPCAVSAPTRRTSPWKASWTCSPSEWASMATTFASATF